MMQYVMVWQDYAEHLSRPKVRCPSGRGHSQCGGVEAEHTRLWKGDPADGEAPQRFPGPWLRSMSLRGPVTPSEGLSPTDFNQVLEQRLRNCQQATSLSSVADNSVFDRHLACVREMGDTVVLKGALVLEFRRAGRLGPRRLHDP